MQRRLLYLHVEGGNQQDPHKGTVIGWRNASLLAFPDDRIDYLGK